MNMTTRTHSSIKNEKSITVEHKCLKEYPIYPEKVIRKEHLTQLLKISDLWDDKQDGNKMTIKTPHERVSLISTFTFVSSDLNIN